MLLHHVTLGAEPSYTKRHYVPPDMSYMISLRFTSNESLHHGATDVARLQYRSTRCLRRIGAPLSGSTFRLRRIGLFSSSEAGCKRYGDLDREYLSVSAYRGGDKPGRIRYGDTDLGDCRRRFKLLSFS